MKKIEKHKIDFRWSGGRVRMVGYTDKRATQELERKLTALAACKEAGERPDAELVRWVEGLSEKMQQKLVKYGLIDPERAAAAKGLLKHLEDYEADMKAKGRDSRHIAQEISKCEKIISGCGFSRHYDVNETKLRRWLADRMDKDGIGPRTANSYTTAFKAFLQWMVPHYASLNPLANMKKLNEAVDIRRERRALSVDELHRILRAAEKGQPFRGMPGRERAILYRVAMQTGLRWSELRSLTRASFALDSEPATVALHASDEKNRKGAILPLHPALVIELKAFFNESLALPSAAAFPNMPNGRAGAAMIRFDLEATGDADNGIDPIPYRDKQGLVADFHALRHSFVTALARSGVHPSVAQSLARHASIELTMGRYTHTAMESQQEAIMGLPSLQGVEADEGVRTGTDDVDEVTETGPEKIDQKLPKSADRRQIDLDGSGLSDLPKAAGAETLSTCDTNEKAPSGSTERGVSFGAVDETRTRNHQIDSLVR